LYCLNLHRRVFSTLVTSPNAQTRLDTRHQTVRHLAVETVSVEIAPHVVLVVAFACVDRFSAIGIGMNGRGAWAAMRGLSMAAAIMQGVVCAHYGVRVFILSRCGVCVRSEHRSLDRVSWWTGKVQRRFGGAKKAQR
jgi:hypothetical protein